MTEERPAEGRREFAPPRALLLQDTALFWLAVLPAAERGRVLGALIAAFWGEGKTPPIDCQPETPQGRAAVEAGLLILAQDREKWERKCEQRSAAGKASAEARARSGAARTPKGIAPDKGADNAQKAAERAAIAELLADEGGPEP